MLEIVAYKTSTLKTGHWTSPSVIKVERIRVREMEAADYAMVKECGVCSSSLSSFETVELSELERQRGLLIRWGPDESLKVNEVRSSLRSLFAANHRLFGINPSHFLAFCYLTACLNLQEFFFLSSRNLKPSYPSPIKF